MITTPPGDVVALALWRVLTSPSGDVVALALQAPGPPEPVPVRYTGRAASLPWTRAPVRQRAARVASAIAPPRAAAAAAAWGAAPIVTHGAGAAWARVAGRSAPSCLPWAAAPIVLQAAAAAAWARIPQAAAATVAPWGIPPHAGQRTAVPWRAPAAQAVAASLPWWIPPRHTGAASLPWSSPAARVRDWRLLWQRGARVRWVVGGPGVTPPMLPPAEPRRPPDGDAVALDFRCPVELSDGDAAHLRFGPAACYGAWPRKRTIVVLNSAAVVRLPERTPIPVSAVRVRTGVDAIFWDVSMSLADPASLALLIADEDGPRVVEININGYVWTAIVESYDRDRRAGSRSVSVSGRSQTALLDEPYAPARARVQSADRQAQQLADEEVDLTGFTVDYGTVTWLVPGGVWHYERQTPIAALREIAAGSGAVLQSHPWDKIVQVRPRYPTSPWDWLATTPDKYISDEIILRDRMTVQSQPHYNYVLVSGEQVGVSDPIQRAGSAGDLRAEQVVDKLITAHEVALERGRNVLSDRGEQSRVTLDIPLFPPTSPDKPGLILPLQLTEVVELVAWRGLAIDCEVSAQTNSDGALVIEQSVTIERHLTDAN